MGDNHQDKVGRGYFETGLHSVTTGGSSHHNVSRKVHHHQRRVHVVGMVDSHHPHTGNAVVLHQKGKARNHRQTKEEGGNQSGVHDQTFPKT